MSQPVVVTRGAKLSLILFVAAMILFAIGLICLLTDNGGKIVQELELGGLTALAGAFVAGSWV